MVTILAQGNHLVVGNFPTTSGRWGIIATNPAQSQPKQGQQEGLWVKNLMCNLTTCVIFHKFSLASQEYAGLGGCAFPSTP